MSISFYAQINMSNRSCRLRTSFLYQLTYWGRVTHICVSDQTTIGSDNGLSPGRRQAIIRTNAGILLIRPLGTNFSEILIEILIFSFKKMRLKVSSAKRRPFCLGFNVLNQLVCLDLLDETWDWMINQNDADRYQKCFSALILKSYIFWQVLSIQIHQS